jgi:aryl-alcohol dehydrogenase-like predicted oxidoreductase
VEQRELGRSGIDITRLILGCGNFGGIGSDPATWGKGTKEDEAFAILDAALERGITTFDTASSYGGGRSEEILGRWIASRRPEQIILSSKAYWPVHEGDDRGLAPERLRRVVDNSLHTLGVERIDLYLFHAPDPDTPLLDSLETLHELRSEGKITAFGVSNVDAQYVRECLRLAAAHDLQRIEWVQNEYSLLAQDAEEELLPLCAREQLGFTPFSPLAGGWLTGKYRRGEAYPAGSRMTLRPDERFAREDVHAALEAFAAQAEERGVQPATLALAWVLSHPDVTAALAGPSTLAHLAPAFDALSVELTPNERDALAKLFP